MHTPFMCMYNHVPKTSVGPIFIILYLTFDNDPGGPKQV